MQHFSAFSIRYNEIVNRLRGEVTLFNGEKSGKFVALWDTGATISCISHDVVQALGLVPTGVGSIRTPSGMDTFCTYQVDIWLPNNVVLHGVQVSGSEIGAQGLGVLIGMNIISQGDFAVSNFQGKTVFTFRTPSIAKADYVRDLHVQKGHGPGKRKKKHK